MGKLFGTNGIRGVPGEDMSVEFVAEVGRALGTYFKKGPILLGRDGRASSLAVSKALASGLMFSGLEVRDAELVPTPCLQYAVKKLGYEGGVMVTASHNPPKYNGIKVMGGDGVEVSREDELKIEEIYLEKKFRKVKWDEIGEVKLEHRAIDEYLNGVIGLVNADEIRRGDFRLIMDIGNGAQAVAAPHMAERLGVKVLTLNGNVDPSFTGRGPEPTPDTLSAMRRAVKELGYDLGVGYDGDGDRAIFCDDKGEAYWGDITGALILDYLLSKSPGSRVVTTVSSSQLIGIVAEKHGSKLIYTKVGSVDVSRAMIEHGALFGIEENGGWFYSPHIPVRDGCMSTALILEVLSKGEDSLSERMVSLPKFYKMKVKVECPEGMKGEVVDKVARASRGRIESVDGMKVWLDERSWVLVRASGTEPLIRIYAESDDEPTVKRIVDEYKEIVEDLIKKNAGSSREA